MRKVWVVLDDDGGDYAGIDSVWSSYALAEKRLLQEKEDSPDDVSYLSIEGPFAVIASAILGRDQ